MSSEVLKVLNQTLDTWNKFFKEKFFNASQKRSHQVLTDELKVLEERLKPEVIEIIESTGLTWHDAYKILALLSIMQLTPHCPYPDCFTSEEWKIIIETNPYKNYEPVISPATSCALWEAIIKHINGKDSFIYPNDTPLSRLTSRVFNELCENIPNLAPEIISEQEHYAQFLYSYINLIFLKRNNEYNVQLDYNVKDTRQRPDFACTVDEVPLMNSEIKPLGCGPLKREKDIIKAYLRAVKSINQQIFAKGRPGESMIFLN
ncbi:16495_t:CDS:2, partial [Racocetra fulgida]